jgi:hypothetical protein
MELLCLKSNNEYLRITGDAYQLTSMNKASVYPITEKDMVKTLYHKFRMESDDLHIVKLTINEEPFDKGSI